MLTQKTKLILSSLRFFHWFLHCNFQYLLTWLLSVLVETIYEKSILLLD
jgi:hypothetical protein